MDAYSISRLRQAITDVFPEFVDLIIRRYETLPDQNAFLASGGLYEDTVVAEYMEEYPDPNHPNAFYVSSSSARIVKGNTHSHGVISIAIRDVILRSSTPLYVPDIKEKLLENGMDVGSPGYISNLLLNKKNNSKKRAFDRTPDGKFWPSDVDVNPDHVGRKTKR